jgi:predicted DNA-binding transcriptional regulator AlpA
MLSKNSGPTDPSVSSRPVTAPVMLTSKETARRLNLSESWLAKRRLAGDGPPYIKLGGAVRYVEASLQQWVEGPAAHLNQRILSEPQANTKSARGQ